MKSGTMVTGWIIDDNLKPFLEIVANFAGYPFDDADWGAFAYTIKCTDVERDEWFEYEMPGSSSVKLKVAQDAGASVVFLTVTAEPAIEGKTAIALEVMQSYRLSR